MGSRVVPSVNSPASMIKDLHRVARNTKPFGKVLGSSESTLSMNLCHMCSETCPEADTYMFCWCSCKCCTWWRSGRLLVSCRLYPWYSMGGEHALIKNSRMLLHKSACVHRHICQVHAIGVLGSTSMWCTLQHCQVPTDVVYVTMVNTCCTFLHQCP